MQAVLVPIRGFEGAKKRLATVLSGPERALLVRDLAARVMSAASPLPVTVVCEWDEVASFARDHGAEVLQVAPGLGLSASVQSGVDHLRAASFETVIVVHADLALLRDLAPFSHDAAVGGRDSVTIAPDRRLDGSNVMSVPTAGGFRFAYGPGSFDRHRGEARRLGLDCRVVYDWSLALDIDLPSDLEVLARSEPEWVAGQIVGGLAQ